MTDGARALAGGTAGDSLGLLDLCTVIRSKQAGPFRLTFDLVFRSASDLAVVRDAGIFTPELIGSLYGVSSASVTRIVFYESGLALKISLVRPHVAGDPYDSDAYGCQQHVPLMELRLPAEVRTTTEPRA